MFVGLGPGSFLAFGDIMCAVAAVVFGALWYVGSRTPRHIGELMIAGRSGNRSSYPQSDVLVLTAPHCRIHSK